MRVQNWVGSRAHTPLSPVTCYPSPLSQNCRTQTKQNKKKCLCEGNLCFWLTAINNCLVHWVSTCDIQTWCTSFRNKTAIICKTLILNCVYIGSNWALFTVQYIQAASLTQQQSKSITCFTVLIIQYCYPNVLISIALNFISIDFWVLGAKLYAIRLDFLSFFPALRSPVFV